MSNTPTTAAFSAPGKAFFAGGYLVLDPKYKAYVVALSARMHAVIEGCEGNSNNQATKITVTSPQFQQGEWVYECNLGTLDIVSSAKNPFIEAVVRAVLAYTNPTTPHDIKITIYSDDEYHSQNANPPRLKQRFAVHDKPINEVPKTGLGSSASLTVVVTAALLSYLLGQTDSDESRDRVHKLSQLAHCTAQGKIGSGFDVASAVFGSIVYQRFTPETLGLLTDPANQTFDSVREAIDKEWQVGAQPVSLPEEYALLMGDVQGGSETPKLVSTVLAWRRANPERALEVWTELDKANMGFVEMLKNGTKEQLADQIAQMRHWLRVMTVESGAPIEPESQTLLLDQATSLDGVIGGVVPGAGGYDAVSMLVEADSIDLIKQAAKAHPDLKNIKWFDLREQTCGLQHEDVSLY